MNKKTKLGILTGSALVVSAPVAAVVSCGIHFGDNYKYYGDIQVITDAGTIADKSFNQSAFEAVRDYADIQAPSEGQKTTFGYSQPKSAITGLLQKAYKTSLMEGSRTLVLPGFLHGDTTGGNAIEFAKENHAKYPDARYISIDGFAADEAAANAVGYYNIGYDAQESGFLAAVYGGIYFNKIMKASEPIKAEVFGGVAIPGGVTSYMDGYLQGINWFNKNKINLPNVQGIAPQFMSGNKASISDFTGSFAAGGATAKVQTMINNGVKMILPVAGVQTADVVNVIGTSSMKGKAFTFGVDVDQSKVYNPEFFLGSALKGIYASTSYAIEELKMHPTRTAFPSFGLASMVKNKGVQDYLDELRKKLKESGVSDFDAYIKTLPTGFAPCEILKDSIPAASGEPTKDNWDLIYENAMDYVKAGNVSGGLTKDSTGDAGETYKLYGGYLEVAKG